MPHLGSEKFYTLFYTRALILSGIGRFVADLKF
jgi:hypothetical protein